MGMDGRMTCCNMAIEMGAKTGIVPHDMMTYRYFEGRRAITPVDLSSDPDAVYAGQRSYDVSELSPQVAIHHNVDQAVPVEDVAGTRVNQVFIGSCTNGRY